MNGHTYEEIRAAVLDLLAGRVDGIRSQGHYSELAGSIAWIFQQRGEVVRNVPGNPLRLVQADEELVNEVFWNFFPRGYHYTRARQFAAAVSVFSRIALGQADPRKSSELFLSRRFHV